MLQAYNSLYPYQFEALKDDEYIIAATSRLDSHNSIINANILSSKTGVLILPSTIHDIDATTFEFRDGKGEPITTEIVKINSGNGWVNVGLSGPIQNTNDLYLEKGKVVFVQFLTPAILYNKTLTGDISTDGVMFSKTYYSRLEMLYNFRLGCHYCKVPETITSIDLLTGDIETNEGSFHTDYPLSISYLVGDTVPIGEFVDKAVTLTLEPPYVKVSIKKEYHYIKRIFSFDSNKIIELLD